MALLDMLNPAEIARGLLEKAGITPEFIAEQWQRFQATLAAWEADRAGFKMASRQIVSMFIERLDKQDAAAAIAAREMREAVAGIAQLKALLLSVQDAPVSPFKANSHEHHDRHG